MLGTRESTDLCLYFLMYIWGTFGRSLPHRLRRESMKNICRIVIEVRWGTIVGYWFQARFLVRNMPANYRENVSMSQISANFVPWFAHWWGEDYVTAKNVAVSPPSSITCFGPFWFLLVCEKKSQLQGRCFQYAIEIEEQSMAVLCAVSVHKFSSAVTASRPLWRE
jgi:hypothetical protein